MKRLITIKKANKMGQKLKSFSFADGDFEKFLTFEFLENSGSEVKVNSEKAGQVINNLKQGGQKNEN